MSSVLICSCTNYRTYSFIANREKYYQTLTNLRSSRCLRPVRRASSSASRAREERGRLRGGRRERRRERYTREIVREGGFEGRREEGTGFLLSNEGDGHLSLWELTNTPYGPSDARIHVQPHMSLRLARKVPYDSHTYTRTCLPPLAINTSAFTSAASCVNATR